ncbi:unnamed protein product, partial [Lampetra planeri]
PLSVKLLSKDLARDIERIIQGTKVKVTNKGCCCMARVANSTMTADEVTENIEATVKTFMAKVNMVRPVIKIIHVKSQKSVALPIYTSNLSHLTLLDAAQVEPVMERRYGGVGRCKCSFWFAVAHDILGVLIMMVGVFGGLVIHDLFIYAGAIVIFFSLIWWVFWYSGNIDVPPEELEDDVGLMKSKKQGLSRVVRRVSDRLSSGIRKLSQKERQFEAVLQHGLRKSRGLALTAAALKQAAGFSSKTEAELTFWFYVKEHLNRHELQRFYSLRHISSELGRGRAWLRCALNEHSLERYLHTLLSDRPRLGTYYEDWAFILDEERASMLPTMAAGLNSILFAINIDNNDLNGGGVTRGGGSSVSHLLKESTQASAAWLKESTQGVSSLLREISTATAVVPGFSPRVDSASDPLPVLPRSTSA